MDSGITSHAVAAALGHESFKTTAESYAHCEAVAGAQQKRVLGVLSTDDPENKATIALLKRELAKCGAGVTHEYYYAQDITRPFRLEGGHVRVPVGPGHGR